MAETQEVKVVEKRILFGTDGIRGKANIYPITCEMALALGRAVTAYFQSKKMSSSPLVVIGKDTRVSCYMLEQAFSAGVCSQGGRAILTGPLPTPGVAFVTRSMRADAGVMISASHNAFSDNGIKIFDRDGHKLPDHIECELEKMILEPHSLNIKTGGELGHAKRLDEVIGRYIVHAKSAFNQNYNLENMRLVVDCAHGAGYKVAPMIFAELGADVIPIGTSPNGRNINEMMGAVYPKTCQDAVLKYRADLGICLDGDADRLTLVDSHGNIVDGDCLIGLCAKFLYDTDELGENKEVVGTVMSNLGLENYLVSHGIKFNRTKVGDRYIVEQMRKSGAVFGGEPSGHLIFKNHSTTGDGILAALKVIEALKFYDRPLEKLAADIKLYPQILKNVAVHSRPPLQSVDEISMAVEKVEEELGQKGRVILRYSGTEDLVRVMVEGEDSAAIEKSCDFLVSTVTKSLCT